MNCLKITAKVYIIKYVQITHIFPTFETLTYAQIPEKIS